MYQRLKSQPAAVVNWHGQLSSYWAAKTAIYASFRNNVSVGAFSPSRKSFRYLQTRIKLWV